jgi:hypothetical protein
LFKKWRRASQPAVEGGILPPGKYPHSLNTPVLQEVPVGDAFSAGLEAAALRQPGWPTLRFSNKLLQDVEQSER